MKIHSNDWEMILNNAHDLLAEYILILIIHYEIVLLVVSRSVCGSLCGQFVSTEPASVW